MGSIGGGDDDMMSLLIPFVRKAGSDLIGLRSGTAWPGVAPIMPLQNRPGPPTGLDSGMNFDGATRVDGGARRGF